jgi:hypothetical protein
MTHKAIAKLETANIGTLAGTRWQTSSRILNWRRVGGGKWRHHSGPWPLPPVTIDSVPVMRGGWVPALGEHTDAIPDGFGAGRSPAGGRKRSDGSEPG